MELLTTFRGGPGRGSELAQNRAEPCNFVQLRESFKTNPKSPALPERPCSGPCPGWPAGAGAIAVKHEEQNEPMNTMNTTFEQLEGRQLMSVSLAKSVLTITGTNKADAIYVQPINGKLEVEVNGAVVKRLAFNKVKQVRISGLKGDDSIGATLPSNMTAWIDGGRGNDVISAGEGNDTVYGGDGDDIIHGNSGNDLINGGRGVDHMDGGDGDDTFAAADGTQDVIDGGDGKDFAKADSFVDHFGMITDKSLDVITDVETVQNLV
jgi:Ca2+-binding RTX toxin-like protein